MNIQPVKRTTQQARIFYDRLSRFYDLFSSASERQFMQIGLSMLAAQPGEWILEIGFGSGHGLAALAPQVLPKGHIFGLDLSTGMATVAQNCLKRKGITSQVSLACGNALCLPWQTATMDACLMSFTLELFDTPDIPLILAECRRVLRFGGRLAVVALSKPRRPLRSVAVYEWFHRRFPLAVDCRPIPAQSLMEAAGFEIIQAQQPRMLGLLPLEIVLGRNSRGIINPQTYL